MFNLDLTVESGILPKAYTRANRVVLLDILMPLTSPIPQLFDGIQIFWLIILLSTHTNRYGLERKTMCRVNSICTTLYF